MFLSTIGNPNLGAARRKSLGNFESPFNTSLVSQSFLYYTRLWWHTLIGLGRIWLLYSHIVHVLIGRHLAKVEDDIEESWKQMKIIQTLYLACCLRRAHKSTTSEDKPWGAGEDEWADVEAWEEPQKRSQEVRRWRTRRRSRRPMIWCGSLRRRIPTTWMILSLCICQLRQELFT